MRCTEETLTPAGAWFSSDACCGVSPGATRRPVSSCPFGTLVAAPPAGPGWLHEMKHMPHGARASFALVSLREDATFVGGRYDNWNCPMVRRP